MKMIESERNEIRIRSMVKEIVAQSFVHPDLVSIPKEHMPDGFHLLNKVGVDIITDKVYQLMLSEINGCENQIN